MKKNSKNVKSGLENPNNTLADVIFPGDILCLKEICPLERSERSERSRKISYKWL